MSFEMNASGNEANGRQEGVTNHSQLKDVSDVDIEGGFVSELPEVTFDERRHRAETASKLAFTFAWILAGALLLHYIAFASLGLLGRNEAMIALSDVFNVWLPAMIGIVSSAATYYFAKER